MSGIGPDSSSRKGRGLRYGLIASFALNVAFLAAAATIGLHAFRHGPPPPPPGGSKADRMIARMTETLPGPDADKMRAAFDRNHAQLERDDEATRQAHDRVSDALRKEPFDVQEFTQAVDDFRAKRRQTEQDFQAGFLEGVTAISPEGRRKLAEMRGF
jgi:uncharacterized membrane protein